MEIAQAVGRLFTDGGDFKIAHAAKIVPRGEDAVEERLNAMKPIADGDRRVINLEDIEFEPFINSDGETDGLAFQHDRSIPLGSGFHIYKMEPGAQSTPHRHGGAEEFVMIEGTLVDHDGTVYGPGDVVWLAPGTEHSSHTETGCLIAVYAEDDETDLPG